MLRLLGPTDRSPLCSGFSRRNFLRIGGLGAAGLALPDLLRAEATTGAGQRRKSVILVYLVGGPPHLDMFDLKPLAPREVAGPFRPIETNVPGIEICEHMPRLARMMDRVAVVRSIVDCQADHDAFQCYTGRDKLRVPVAGGWPTIGSAVARLQGPAARGMPPYVSLCYPCTHPPYNEPGPGFVGVAHTPFRPLGDGRADLVLNGITHDRLHDRRQLLESVDRFRRAADASGTMTGIDAFTEQALGVLTSSRLVEALDLSREDPKVVERYGTGNPNVFIDDTDNIIVGSIGKFIMNGEAEITYWIDRKFWGQGIATQALKKFLAIETTRPIFGRVAFDNFGSQKVLEKCSFDKIGTDKGFANARQKEIEEFIYKLT